MTHTVDSCPLTKLDDGLSSRLHAADDDAVVQWLANLVRRTQIWQEENKRKTKNWFIVNYSWNERPSSQLEIALKQWLCSTPLPCSSCVWC